MDELALRAGITKPVIYGQFGSKEGLLVELVDDLGRGLNLAVAEAVAGRTEPEDLLRAGSLAFFGFIGERHATWSMIYGASRSLTESVASPAADKIEEIRRRQDSLVSAVILAVAKEGGSAPEPLELGAITRALNGIYEGLVEWWREHTGTSPEQLSDWVIALVLPGLERLATR